ncbi:hypothetical protein HDV00_005600 [Rhizophlyctis rosea]|nr:hypothetical protein HDV00_005600 [Rhizophlyctis rosea]
MLHQTLLTILTLITLIYAQVDVPQCQPSDIDCFISKAQYTILGTTLSTNQNQGNSTTGVIASAQNYNATVQIQCVYASANPTANDGSSILNQQVTVTGFGSPRSACTNGGGATTVANTSTIFFLFVSNSPPKGQIPVLSVFDICTGGVPYNNDNIARVGQVLAKNPQQAFYGASRGPSSCTIPGLSTDSAPPNTATATNGPGSTANLPGAGHSLAMERSSLVGILAGLLAIAGASMWA